MNDQDCRVLLVEDNAIAQIQGKRFLEKLGYPVDLAPTAKRAIELASKYKYHLILMDINLPDGDGVDISRAIRQADYSPTNCQTPIVVVTSHFYHPEDKEICYKMGINLVLPKPLNEESIQLILKEIWG